MYSLHQPHLLRGTLPQSLRNVPLDHPDSHAFHNQVSEGLTEGRGQKRAKATEKRKATLTAKKKGKDKQAQVEAEQGVHSILELDEDEEYSDDDGPESEDE